MTRPLRVKFILPALTEATSPYWRPIKYSLFPPLGLATLAAYLAPDDEAEIVDEHVERARRRRRAGSRRDPGLHHQRVARLPDRRRATARAGVFVALGGLHVTSLPDEAAAHADADLPRPGRADVPAVPRGLPRRARRGGATSPRRAGRSSGCRRSGAISIDRRRYLVPELDRRHARLPAALRLLLQGRVLRGRPLVLHAARGRRARGDRAAAGPAPVLPGRSSARRSALRRGAVRRACAAWTACSRAPRRSTRSSAAI